MLKKNIFFRILPIVLIAGGNLAYAATLIYTWKRTGILIPSSEASSDIVGILLQNLILLLYPAILFIIFKLMLKKDFAELMYLKPGGRWQRGVIIVLSGILLALTVHGLVVKDDRLTVLHNAFYYVAVIAFTEEFVDRDVCTYFLRNDKTAVRYIVPNLLFAIMHIFSYSGWGNITGAYLLDFLRSDLLMIFAAGCFFQFLKERSGTIWIPVLLHGIIDLVIE